VKMTRATEDRFMSLRVYRIDTSEQLNPGSTFCTAGARPGSETPWYCGALTIGGRK